MTDVNIATNFVGDSNHGFQLGSNFGHVHVDFHGQPNNLEKIDFSNEERRCFETIRTINYLARKDLNPKRLPGTCNWFFDHTKYQGWISQTPASRLLWVSADPGCGKSVLAKALVDQYDRGNVCYYFFKDDTAITRSAAHAICAILHQICDSRPALIKYVLPMYRSNGEKLVDLFEDLWSAFVDVINDKGFGSIICIFDAVDECSDDDFKKLLQRLAAIAISSSSIKILITSRPYTSIETALFHRTGLDKNEIRLSGEAKAEQTMIEKEVGLYITSRVQEFRELRESLNIFDNAPEKVQVHLDGVKNRTYLWVSAVFDELLREVDASEYTLMETINTLPDNVHHAYEKILEKSPKKKLLIRVLHSMLAAFEPLSVMEMNMILSIHDTSSGGPRQRGLHPVDSFCNWLRNLCGYFISIIDDKLYFTHQTAREFLVGEKSYQATVGWRGLFQTADSHTCVARACIDYLLRWYDGSVDSTFQAYATLYWPAHCQQSAVNHSLKEKMNAFLFHSNTFARWSMDAGRFSRPWILEDSRIVSSIGSPPTPFFLACNFGWLSVIHALISSSDIDCNRRNKEGETGLAIAAREGHSDTVRFLLIAGANIDLQNHKGGETALIFSVQEYHPEIVKLLLAAKADVNVSSRAGTALDLAAVTGQLDVVELLLNAGADITIQNKRGETALYAAASEGRREVVKILLNAQANVNAESEQGTALHVAASRGHLETVKLLLAAGAEFEVRNKVHGRTALHFAALAGYSEILTLLLKAGADVNAESYAKYTVLHEAASSGYREAVKLLLAAGADFEVRNEYRETALHFSVENDHLDIVDLLLKAGANVNAESEEGTALHIAASRGRLETVKLLLAAGAKLEIPSKYGETALHSAAQRNHLDIIDLLLKAGANVNAESKEGTALHIAASRGRLETVKLLLAAGAKLEIPSKYGETALHSAAQRNHLDIIDLLLKAGVNVNAESEEGTALHIAASREYLESVKLLLAAGAEFEVRNELGETALYSAVEMDHPEIIKLLLEAGSNVNTQSDEGTALHVAASGGHLETVKLLLAAGAEFEVRNEFGETALYSAVETDHPEIIKLLLEAGSNVNTQSDEGTALHVAASGGHLETVKLLLAAGAEFEVRNEYGETALHFAVKWDHHEIIDLLLKAGANVNAESEEGTALHVAALRGSLEAVNLLLAAGAEFEIPNKNGETALHSAVKMDHLEIVKLLLEAGPNVNRQSDEGTALYVAASRGHFETVTLLLAAGAKFEVRDEKEETAWRSAASAGHIEVLTLLWKAGANHNRLARRWDYYVEIAELLLAAGAIN